MKHLLVFVLWVGTACIGYSQNKIFTVKDTEVGIRRELAPTTMQNIQWRGIGNNFTFQDFGNIYQQSVTSADTVKLLSLIDLNQILKQAGEDTLIYIPSITWGNEQEFYFFTPNRWFNVHLAEKKITGSITIPEKAGNITLFYPGKKIAYTVDNNLFVTGITNLQVQITNDRRGDIVNGQPVSRNEFGINEGIFWSPQGNYIAFYRKDNTHVGNYPLVDITKREAELVDIKYPMAGMASENVSLGIYNIATAKSVFIDKEDTVSEKYLTNISWAPDEKFVFIQVLNRQQDHMKLNKYQASDGVMVNTLFEEQNNRYVEPLNPLIFLHKNKNAFIYQSRRDGYNHAYLYNSDGSFIKQLTTGNWEVTGILDVDNQDNVYYTSKEESPIEEHAYRVNAETLKKTRLTYLAGTHKVILNKNFKYRIDDYSNTSIPHKTDLVSATGKVMRNLVTSRNPLLTYKMPQMNIGTLKSADGTTDLFYRLIKPAGFDSTKKYPAIIYVYGGPHAQLINNQWLGGARLWDYMMAQKGYVVLTVDNRGSANRGMAFESVIHRHCGVAEMQDQMEGVKLLKKLGYVDMSRLGVHGWSYGGFMTISLMVNYPGVFKTAVAGGPVIDWKYYEVMYGERYMDTPQENLEGYTSTSLIPKAANLKGKLLIIHGAVDPTVVWQNSLLFIQECIKNQVPVDYFVYPRSEHNVRGTDRIHLMGKITSYFDDYL